MMSGDMKIVVKQGIHARPASLFVQKASSFQSKVTIRSEDKIADGKSILGILLLALPPGSTIRLEVEGTDEKEAFESLQEILKRESI